MYIYIYIYIYIISFSLLDSSGNFSSSHTALIGQLYRCLRFSDWPISIHNWVIMFFRTLILTFYALMSVRRKSFQSICYKMFAFFKAINKIISLRHIL